MRKWKWSKKEVADAAGAASGLSIAIAFGVSVAVSLLAPTGIAAVLVAVGLQSPPLLVVAAPAVLLLCAAVGAIAGLVRFFSWLFEKSGRKRDVSTPRTSIDER
jgi:membrane protein YdbS with pleckstrin-like domain